MNNNMKMYNGGAIDIDEGEEYNLEKLNKYVLSRNPLNPPKVSNLPMPVLWSNPDTDAVRRIKAKSVIIGQKAGNAFICGFTFDKTICVLYKIAVKAPRKGFISADAAAIDFAKKYNEESIRAKREFGSAIYSYKIHNTIPLNIISSYPLAAKNENAKTLYGYTEPIQGGLIGPETDFEAYVNVSEAPKGTIEVAQIHTHSCYVYVKIFDGVQEIAHNSRDSMFSPPDIDTAEKRKVDTYVVNCHGVMYKASKNKDYADKYDIFKTGFYIDPQIEIQDGKILDLTENPSIWWEL